MGIPAPAGVDASGLPPAGDQATAVLSGVISAVGPTQPFAFRGPMNLAIWASLATALTTTAASLTATVGSGTGLAAGVAVNSVNVPRGTTYGTFSGTSGALALPPITIYGTTNTFEPVIRGLDSTAGLVGATVTGPGIPSGTTVVSVDTAAIAATNISTGTLGAVRISNTPTSAPVINGRQPFTFAPTANGITVTGADANATFTGAAITFSATVQVERSFDGGLTWVVCNAGTGVLAQFTGIAVTPISITFGEPERNVLYRLNCTAYSSGTINYRVSQTGGANESLAIGPLSGG